MNLDNQIQTKFIREGNKPFPSNKSLLISSNTNSFTIPNYSQFQLTPPPPKMTSVSFSSIPPPIKKLNLNNDLIKEEISQDKPIGNINPIPNYTENIELILNCRNIHSHILNCPVCSKIYKCHNYNLFYIIIIILVIIILVMLKYFYK